MNAMKNTIVNLPVSVLLAILVTAVLFMGLPILTRYQRVFQVRETGHQMKDFSRRPPPPPEPEQQRKVERKELRQETQKTKQVTRTERPRFDIPTGMGAGIGGTIAIGGLDASDIQISDSLFLTAFNLSEVDQPPRILRSVPPRYPFQAMQKGMEGRITLRFVVDRNGIPQEPEVVDVDPPEVGDVFNSSAIETVRKYTFRPAVKDGKPVDVIVRQPIVFSLN